MKLKPLLHLTASLTLGALPHVFAETPQNYTIIENLAKEPILTPSLSQQKTLKIRLDNGLEAILISDPTIDESAAAITVKAGSFEDSEETPGIAHFLEHMLFLGTKNHPQESGFQHFIAENGGITNAFTTNDFTSYLFSVNNNAFKESLERFSEFFKDPLFNPSGVSRELQAIDQEYAKNVQNDDIRTLYVIKESANPKHPYHHFGMGNSQTLSKVSQKTLIEWYNNHYSANLMRLVVYSKLPMDDLKNLVVQNFSGIVNKNIAALKPTEVPISIDNNNKIFYVEPVKNLRNLTLVWNLPEKFSNVLDRQPEAYVCHILGDESKNSLLAELKKQDLAEKLSCGSFRIGPGSQVFYMDVDLTAQGVKSVNTVINTIFQAIASLKNSDFPQYIFDEVQQVSKNRYRYKNREKLFETVMKDAMKLPFENIETYPVHSSIPQKFDKELIKELVAFLTPTNAQFILLAPSSLTGVPPTNKEKWLGVQYAVMPIATNQMDAWKNAAASSVIGLPEKNQFIPKNLDVLKKAEISKEDSVPVPKGKAIIDNEKAQVYFASDSFFGMPESYLYFEIKTPEIKSGIFDSVVLADLYIKALNDGLNKLSYPALVAGLNYDIQRTDNGISITVSGFNDNSEVLFKKIVDQLNSVTITEEKFSIFKESLLREYTNAYKSSPLKPASDLLKSAIYKNYTNEVEKSEAIHNITFEIFKNSLSKLFKETFVEGFIYGNKDEENAKNIANALIDTLKGNPYLKKDQQKREVIVLPKNEGPFYLEKLIDVQGNAIILLIEQDEFTFKRRAAQQILMQAISGPFFSTLRTKQQTGYIVDSSDQEIEDKLFNLFVIQSNTHDPLTLLSRMELFIEDFVQEIEINITKENFETLKAALIQNLTHENNSIKSMGELLKTIAFKKNADFDWRNKLVLGFLDLSYEEFIDISKKFFAKTNKQRLAIMIDGEIPNEKSLNYKVQTLKQLRQLSDYSSGNCCDFYPNGVR